MGISLTVKYIHTSSLLNKLKRLQYKLQFSSVNKKETGNKAVEPVKSYLIGRTCKHESSVFIKKKEKYVKIPCKNQTSQCFNKLVALEYYKMARWV